MAMPYSVCGISMAHTLAPVSRRRSTNFLNPAMYRSVQAILEILGGNPDAETAYRPFEAFVKGRHRNSRAGGILGVSACHHRQHGAGIFHGMGNRTDTVEGRGIGYEAIPADASIRGLESHYATKGCWLPDRASCIRPKGCMAHPGGYRGCRAAGRAAGARSRRTVDSERVQGTSFRWTSPSRIHRNLSCQ